MHKTSYVSVGTLVHATMRHCGVVSQESQGRGTTSGSLVLSISSTYASFIFTMHFPFPPLCGSVEFSKGNLSK